MIFMKIILETYNSKIYLSWILYIDIGVLFELVLILFVVV